MIMVPSNAARHLARKKTALEQRRARLAANISEIDSALAQIRNAEQVLRAPRNGRAVKLPELLQALPITQKDRVLATVRLRRASGSTRQLIIQKLDQHGIGANNVSTYLTQLKRDGLVRYASGLWFPT
jgi:hypothetical protein